MAGGASARRSKRIKAFTGSKSGVSAKKALAPSRSGGRFAKSPRNAGKLKVGGRNGKVLTKNFFKASAARKAADEKKKPRTTTGQQIRAAAARR